MAKVRRRKDRSGWIVDLRTLGRGRVTVPTREFADELLAKAIEEGPARDAKDRDVTVGAFSAAWLEQIEASHDPRTVDCYRTTLKLYVLPYLKDERIRDLTPGALDELLGGLRKNGLGKSSCGLVRSVLSSMFSKAIRYHIIRHNPAHVLDRTKQPDTVTAIDKVNRVRSKVLELRQLAQLLEAASRSSRRNHLLLLMAADTGARPGEVCAAKWQDFDASRMTFHIERSVDARQRIKQTKTHAVRDVIVSDRLAAALTDYRAVLDAESLVAGKQIPEWVFPSPAGGPITPRRASTILRSIANAAGLSAFPLYSLRHSYASHMANGIAPIQHVSSQLGHRRTSMTHDVYVHPMAPDRSYISALEHARQAVHGTSPGTYPQAGRQPVENMSLASAGASSADTGPGPA